MTGEKRKHRSALRALNKLDRSRFTLRVAYFVTPKVKFVRLIDFIYFHEKFVKSFLTLLESSLIPHYCLEITEFYCHSFFANFPSIQRFTKELYSKSIWRKKCGSQSVKTDFKSVVRNRLDSTWLDWLRTLKTTHLI